MATDKMVKSSVKGVMSLMMETILPAMSHALKNSEEKASLLWRLGWITKANFSTEISTDSAYLRILLLASPTRVNISMVCAMVLVCLSLVALAILEPSLTTGTMDMVTIVSLMHIMRENSAIAKSAVSVLKSLKAKPNIGAKCATINVMVGVSILSRTGVPTQVSSKMVIDTVVAP